MLLIDSDLFVLRCSDCKSVIDIPLRDRAAHSRLAFRDRMTREHKCQQPAKIKPAEQATAAPVSKTWAELIAPYESELAAIGHRGDSRAI
jgi:hypothetical protein